MISNVDIKDWVMLTEPLTLDQLKDGDFFSVFGDNKVFKLIASANQIAFAETDDIFNAFALPAFMKVFVWKQK